MKKPTECYMAVSCTDMALVWTASYRKRDVIEYCKEDYDEQNWRKLKKHYGLTIKKVNITPVIKEQSND